MNNIDGRVTIVIILLYLIGNRPPRFDRQAREGTGEKLNFEKPPQDFNK